MHINVYYGKSALLFTIFLEISRWNLPLNSILKGYPDNRPKRNKHVIIKNNFVLIFAYIPALVSSCPCYSYSCHLSMQDNPPVAYGYSVYRGWRGQQYKMRSHGCRPIMDLLYRALILGPLLHRAYRRSIFIRYIYYSAHVWQYIHEIYMWVTSMPWSHPHLERMFQETSACLRKSLRIELWPDRKWVKALAISLNMRAGNVPEADFCLLISIQTCKLVGQRAHINGKYWKNASSMLI